MIKGISGHYYIKQDAVGSGAFGKVINVQHKETGEKLICKTEILQDRYSTLIFESWVIQRFTASLRGTGM